MIFQHERNDAPWCVQKNQMLFDLLCISHSEGGMCSSEFYQTFMVFEHVYELRLPLVVQRVQRDRGVVRVVVEVLGSAEVLTRVEEWNALARQKNDAGEFLRVLELFFRPSPRSAGLRGKVIFVPKRVVVVTFSVVYGLLG
jgi:hypothetical protein